jgi:hypothetical protein
LVVEGGYELLEADVVLGEPRSLRLERRGEPGELLIRGEETLPHDRGSRHREIDRPEERVVELSLFPRQLIRWRGRQPDEMHLAELLDGGAHDIAPERGQVVALVEDDRPDTVAAQDVQPLAGAGAEQVSESQVTVLGAGNLALERGGDVGKLASAASRRHAGPCSRLAVGLVDRPPRRGCAFARPPPLGEIPECNGGIVETRERLIGETRDRRVRLRRSKSGLGPERRRNAKPLSLDGRVRNEHERPLSEPPDDLHPQQRLAGARRRDDVRAPATAAPVPFERLERKLLVATPGSSERELGCEASHRHEEAA